LQPQGTAREGSRSLTLHAATVWLHRNVPGRREVKDTTPFPLQLPGGIAIYPSDGFDYPRLPLLGLRAILKNKLTFTIDGKREHASLRSPLW
jgi:hypothetical protein